MKRYIYLTLILPILFLISCVVTPNYQYTITYYVDDIKMNLSPSGYNQGDEFTLPIPSLPKIKVFDGWYLSNDYTGEKIEKITNKNTSNLTLYGKTLSIDNLNTIEYYIDNEKVDYSLRVYFDGETKELPTPEINSNQIFDGWYLNKELTGEKHTSLKDLNGNLTLYGTIKTNSTILPDDNYKEILKQNFNSSAYEFSILCDMDNELFLETFKISGKNYYYESDDETLYLALVDGLYRYYFQDYDGEYYYLLETDEDYQYSAEYFFVQDLTKINIDKFIKENDYFTVSKEYLNEIGYIFTGYEEEYSSFKLYLKKNKIDIVELESTVEYDNETYHCSYIIEFSNFDSTTITLPNASYYYETTSSKITPIKDVYQLSKSDIVTIEGVVTGIYGNNFFISDNEKGILVYMSNDDTYNSIVEIGTSLKLTGSIDIYKTIHQIKDLTEISIINKEFNYSKPSLNDVSQSKLSLYVNDLIDVNNLKIETLPTSYELFSKDTSFICSINQTEVTIFISKHVDSATKENLFNILQNQNINDIISLENIHVSYYNNYQLVLTNNSVIKENNNNYPYLETTIKQKTFDYNTELNDILNQITVYEVLDSNTKNLIDLNDCEINTDNYQPGKSGTFDFIINYNNLSSTIKVTIKNELEKLQKYEINKSLLPDVIKNMSYDPSTGITYGVNLGLPSIGEPKVLVIPIEFTNKLASKDMVPNLNKAFFGTSMDTGWESLQSYYYKSSYGKLNIQGTVLEPFNTGYTVEYYENLQKQYIKDLDAYYNYETDTYPDPVEYKILKSALEYYDDQINYDDYDYNKDGYIDSIYLVYTEEYNYDEESLWWAFTNEYYTDDYEYYDNVEADFYTFLSYEFLFEQFHNKTINLNTETIIHETGHLLGLDDYYDYDETTGPKGGIGGSDMMDYNIGDHNAYSKLLLGWISPYIVNGENANIDLTPFQKNGDVVIIFKEWKNTFFDEYLIIDFFTPDGLNQASSGEFGMFTKSGIRIYHVNSTLNSPSDCYSIFELTLYNNSYTSKRLISLIEADGKNDINQNQYSSDSDLFYVGDSYTPLKWQDNTSCGFTITVNSLSNEIANITIEYK